MSDIIGKINYPPSEQRASGMVWYEGLICHGKPHTHSVPGMTYFLIVMSSLSEDGHLSVQTRLAKLYLLMAGFMLDNGLKAYHMVRVK